MHHSNMQEVHYFPYISKHDWNTLHEFTWKEGCPGMRDDNAGELFLQQAQNRPLNPKSCEDFGTVNC